MTAWGYLRLPWKCCQPPTPQAVFAHLHNESKHLCPPEELMASLRGPFGDSLPTSDLTKPPRNRAPDGRMGDTRHRKPAARKTPEAERDSQSTTEPTWADPRPGCSQRLHWTALLCFWGCYDSQEFANQSRPGKEFCPWPQKFVFPNCLLRVPAVPFDTYQMAKAGTWRPPSRKVISIWNNWDLVRRDLGVIGGATWQESVENYYSKSQREPHHLLEESSVPV